MSVPDADRQKYKQTDKQTNRQTDDLSRLRQRISEQKYKLKTARGQGAPIPVLIILVQTQKEISKEFHSAG